MASLSGASTNNYADVVVLAEHGVLAQHLDAVGRHFVWTKTADEILQRLGV